MPADISASMKIGRKPKLSETVAAALKTQILSGELRPGDKLPTESQLTGVFGVSRTVIREAVANLSADHLVESRQGAGIFVCGRQQTVSYTAVAQEIGFKISHALNVIEVRVGFEIESAGLAAERRNTAQEAAIQEAFFEFDRLLALGELTGRSDFKFHHAIAEATNNPYYVEVLDALGARAIPCDVGSPWGTDNELSREYQMTLQREHLEILKAISAGNADAARAAMRMHLTNSQQRYRALLSDQQIEYLNGDRLAASPSTGGRQ